MSAQQELVAKYVELQKQWDTLDAERDRLHEEMNSLNTQQGHLETEYASKILKYKEGDLFRDKKGRRITIISARVSVDIDRKNKVTVEKNYKIKGDWEKEAHTRTEARLNTLILEKDYTPITADDWYLPKTAVVTECKILEQEGMHKTMLFLTKRGICVKGEFYGIWDLDPKIHKLRLVRYNDETKLCRVHSDKTRSNVSTVHIYAVFGSTTEAVEELL